MYRAVLYSGGYKLVTSDKGSTVIEVDSSKKSVLKQGCGLHIIFGMQKTSKRYLKFLTIPPKKCTNKIKCCQNLVSEFACNCEVW